MKVKIMSYKWVLSALAKSKEVAKVLKTMYRESRKSKFGVTLSKLANLTKIERHRLVGMVEVLSVLGILVVAQLGMSKVITLNPKTIKLIRKTLVS